MTSAYSIQGSDGLNLHVREWGDPEGIPILFIHGWSANHMAWKYQYESALSDKFRLVALDLRGHGMSDTPLKKSTILTASSGQTTSQRLLKNSTWSSRCWWDGHTAVMLFVITCQFTDNLQYRA